MVISKNLKKLLVSSMALIMLSSIGASASQVNVNAKHVRTHRTIHLRHHSRKALRRYAHLRNVHKYNIKKLHHRKNLRKIKTYKHKHNSKYIAKHHKRNHKARVTHSKKHLLGYVRNSTSPKLKSSKASNICIAQNYDAGAPALTGKWPVDGTFAGDENDFSTHDLKADYYDLAPNLDSGNFHLGLNTFNNDKYWFQGHDNFFGTKPIVNIYRLHNNVSSYNHLTPYAYPDYTSNGAKCYDVNDDPKANDPSNGSYTNYSEEWPTNKYNQKMPVIGYFFLNHYNGKSFNNPNNPD